MNRLLHKNSKIKLFPLTNGPKERYNPIAGLPLNGPAELIFIEEDI